MKPDKTRLWIFGIMTLAVMALIFFMSAQDGNESGSLSEWLLNTAFGQRLIRILPRLTEYGEELDIRKYAHMAEYGLLAFPSVLFFLELLLERRIRFPWRSAGASLAFCFLYACSDELHQIFVPGRVVAFTDVLVDLTGSGFIILIMLLILMLRKESR